MSDPAPSAPSTSTDTTAQRKSKPKAKSATLRAMRESKNNNSTNNNNNKDALAFNRVASHAEEWDVIEKPATSGMGPFVRINIENRHGDLPRGPNGEWTHTFESKEVAHGCGNAVNTDEGFVIGFGASSYQRIINAAEFVHTTRPLVVLGRSYDVQHSGRTELPGPPLESEDGRGNMWYGHDQRCVIGYPVPKTANVGGKVIAMDSTDRHGYLSARRHGSFFYTPPHAKDEGSASDTAFQIRNMYWRQPLAIPDSAYDATGVGKLFYTADASRIGADRDYRLDMNMMPMVFTHMGAWRPIDAYDTRAYVDMDADGSHQLHKIGGPKDLHAQTDDPFWFDRGMAPRADTGYAQTLHNRYNATFRQFYHAQIGDWCPLLGTHPGQFQERMLWIVDGAGAAGVVPHDLLWMLLPSYQSLMWLPSMDSIGMDTVLRRKQMTFNPSSLVGGCNTCGPVSDLLNAQTDQQRAKREKLMGVAMRPVANPYRDFGQAAAVAAIAFPIARAQSIACAGNVDEGWLASFVQAAEQYGLIRDVPAPKGVKYRNLQGNNPVDGGRTWRCAEQTRVDGVHPLLRRGADEDARPLYGAHQYTDTFLLSYFPEATNVDLARLSPSFMFTMFGLRRPRVLSEDGVSHTHVHNLERRWLYSPLAAAQGGFWQLPVDATRCEAQHPRHYSTLAEGSFFPERWANSVGGPLWWELSHAFADAPAALKALLFPDDVVLHQIETLNRRCKSVLAARYDLEQKTERWFPFPRTHPQLYRDLFQTRPDRRFYSAQDRRRWGKTVTAADVDLAYEAFEMVYTSREAQAVRQHARGVDGWYSCFDTHRSVAHPQSCAAWNATTGIEPAGFCTLSERNALDGGAAARGLLALLAHYHMATRVDPVHARGMDWVGSAAARRDAVPSGQLSGLTISIWDRALVGAGYQLLAPGTDAGVALGEAAQMASGKRSYSATHIAKWVPRQAPTLRRALLRMPAVLRNAFDVPSLTRAPPPANRSAAMLRTDPINPPADEVAAELLRARALKTLLRSKINEDTQEAHAASFRLQEADLLGGLNRGMSMAAFRIGLVALPEWIQMRRDNEFPLHTFASPTRVDVVEPFSHFLEAAASQYSIECVRDHLLWMTVPRDTNRPASERQKVKSVSSHLGEREPTKDARHVEEVARNLISGLAAEFGVVLAGIANELSPYAEARFAWRTSTDGSPKGRARLKRFEQLWTHVCMPFSMTYTDPNIDINSTSLGANPFVVSGTALVALAVEREVDPAAYAACLELLQMGEAALGVNGRSANEDPEVAWRTGKTFASMRRRGGHAHNSLTTTPYKMRKDRNARAALQRVRELLVPPLVLNDAAWARRPAAQRNWCIGASENVTVPCWPDFDVPLDGAGSRRATEDTHRYLVLRRHLHSWLGAGRCLNAAALESSPLIFSGLHRVLTGKVPDLHVEFEPPMRMATAYATLHDVCESKNTDPRRSSKRYRVELPDCDRRWWMCDADQARARDVHDNYTDKWDAPYQSALYGPIGTVEEREDREQDKRENGTYLEKAPYRKAFRARLEDIAEAAARVAAAVVLERNVGELRWYVGSVTVIDDGRLPRQRVRRRNRWVAVTDEEEAAAAVTEATHPQEPGAFHGSRFPSAGGIGTGNAGDGPLPVGSASEEARRTRLAVLRVREPLRRAQRVLHTRTILKPQLQAALLDKTRGLLQRTKERERTVAQKAALHAQMSGYAGMQATEAGNAEARLRNGIAHRQALAQKQ